MCSWTIVSLRFRLTWWPTRERLKDDRSSWVWWFCLIFFSSFPLGSTAHWEPWYIRTTTRLPSSKTYSGFFGVARAHRSDSPWALTPVSFLFHISEFIREYYSPLCVLMTVFKRYEQHYNSDLSIMDQLVR